LDVYTVKSILQGMHLAVYSTIKPGGLHRLRLEGGVDQVYSSILSVSDYLLEATSLGVKVRRGELAATHMGFGKLLAKALREAYRWNPKHVYPDYIVPSMVYAFAIAYSEPESIISDYGKVKRGLELVLYSRNWREIKSFIDSLRSVHREDMYQHLTMTGYTGLGAIRGEASFHDIFSTLASKWPGYRSLDLREGISRYVKKLLEYYHEYNDANNALIKLYIDLVIPRMPEWARRELEEAVSEGLMLTKEGSKKLFNIDLKLRREGVGFEEYTAFLGVVAGLAVYEGFRP